MLTSVDVYSEANNLVITLPVFAPEPTGPYLVKKIDGLAPAKADIFTASNLGADGSVFKGARTGERNIVLLLGYNQDDPARRANVYLRGDIYERFPPKGKVRMVFHSDNYESIQIEGWVESIEAEPFSRQPDVQISIICPDPYFKALSQLSTNRGVDGENLELFKTGNAPMPFIFRTEPLKEACGLIQLKTAIGPTLSIYHDFQPNDVLYVNVTPGEKQVKIYRWGSLHANALDGVKRGGLNMVIDTVSTYLRVISDGPTTGSIKYTVWYTPRYLGL